MTDRREDQACPETDCDGKLEYVPDHPESGCNCHNAPPCSYCVEQHLACDTCGWEEPE